MMELAFRSRGRTKLSPEGDKKHWFKKAVTPLIGQDLAYRKKQMFTVPVGEWFRGERHEWLRELVMSDELADWFQPQVLDGLLQSHREGRANHTRELRALAALALWRRGTREAPLA
jgi:asparagine synthase (glutamine-hydrolysing)